MFQKWNYALNSHKKATEWTCPYLPVLQIAGDVPTAVAPRVSLVQTVWKDLYPPAVRERQIQSQKACRSFQLWGVFLYHRWWSVCTSWCLTRSLSSHVIPEMDALCLGISRVNRGDEDCGFTGRKDVSCSAGHHVEACTAQRAGKAHTPPFFITQHHIRLPWWTFPHP